MYDGTRHEVVGKQIHVQRSTHQDEPKIGVLRQDVTQNY